MVTGKKLMVPILRPQVVTRKNSKLVVQRDRRQAGNAALVAIELLQEISNRLRAIEASTASVDGVLHETLPQGKTRTRRFTASGKRLVTLLYSGPKQFAISVWNYGPSKIYVRVNSKTEEDPLELEANEQGEMDMKRGVITEVHINCDTGGTATGKILSKY